MVSGGMKEKAEVPLKPSLFPQVIWDRSHFLYIQGGTCCESFSFLTTIVRFVLFGSMLHALERHFFTALLFLIQNLSISLFLENVMACLNKAVILKCGALNLSDILRHWNTANEKAWSNSFFNSLFRWKKREFYWLWGTSIETLAMAVFPEMSVAWYVIV